MYHDTHKILKKIKIKIKLLPMSSSWIGPFFSFFLSFFRGRKKSLDGSFLVLLVKLVLSPNLDKLWTKRSHQKKERNKHLNPKHSHPKKKTKKKKGITKIRGFKKKKKKNNLKQIFFFIFLFFFFFFFGGILLFFPRKIGIYFSCFSCTIWTTFVISWIIFTKFSA